MASLHPMKQASLELNLSLKKTRKREFLEQMERVVPWAALVALIAPYYPEGRTGRRPFALETMLRTHFLQQWFSLSDPAMEEAFFDVPLYREFAQLDAHGRLPDESTILRFRHRLERHKLAEQILATVNALLQAKRNENTLAVMFIDLDRFKVVNDTCGHTAGDELLRQIAKLFQDVLGPDDHLCRLGGDEFGMVLTEQTLSQALRVAERLQQGLAAYRFVWQDQSFGVGVSIGMVQLDAYSESVGALLQAADSACYVAKDFGRGRIHVYATDDPALAQPTRRRRRWQGVDAHEQRRRHRQRACRGRRVRLSGSFFLPKAF